ncbi:MAG: hypothetical protein KAW92_12110 [Candidatus Cloacimonetes bacterium]|nr:hypothetical protein [Candidatus Cloacimonadota bacterium]
MIRYSLTGFVTLIILAFCLIACDIKLTSPGSYDAPTDLEIKKIEEGRVELSWKYPVSTEDTLQFVIAKRIGKGTWIETDSILVESPPFNFPDNILTNDSLIYAYKVKVHNVETDIYSQFSEVIAYLSPQTAPTDLNIVQTSQEKLKISWKDHCMGEDGYYVDKKMWDGSWTDKYRILAANSTSFVDSTNLFETVYYRVWVFVGESKKGGIENSIVPTLPAPDSLTLEKPDIRKIKISWDDNSQGEDGFYIDKKIGELDWITEYDSVDSNVTYLIDDIPQPCGTFYYRVRAFCDTSYSWYSNEEHINILLELKGSLNTSGEATEVFVSNWKAFVADQYNGLVLIDCSNPSAPDKISSISFNDRTLSVFADNDFAYVTNHNGGLNIVDINPLVKIDSCAIAGVPNDVFVSGDFAYIAIGEDGVSILTTTAPLGFMGNCGTDGDARRVFIQDNYAFIANGLNGGIAILDVSEPSNPSFVSDFPIAGLAQDVYVLGNYAYLANGEKGLEIFDISNVNSPTPVANCPTNGFAYSVYARDNYVYLADKEKGLFVIDVSVSNPLAPYILGTFEMTTEPVSIYLYGSYAFLADNEGLKIVQVAP